ncbi:unnamed protein product [Lactuca saligna]|uniref:Uncharacterized protein n=1 Tax=Lactuca saligna TaxID=75948 RepID=A0AA35VRY1_LACSI|nr:unnamed protein product [Lactuca saligna]
MIMSGKHFKILNFKLNNLFQIPADTGGRKFLFGVEMEYLLKSQDNCLCTLVECIKEKQVEWLYAHSKNFEYEIQKLRDVAKERHDVFIEQVTKMKESVDLQGAELKSEMAKKVEKME